MILHCFTDEVDTFVAETTEEALELWLTFHGEKKEDYPIEEWSQIPDGEIFAIYNEDEESSESKTAYEWALVNGKGFLCSKEY